MNARSPQLAALFFDCVYISAAGRFAAGRPIVR